MQRKENNQPQFIVLNTQVNERKTMYRTKFLIYINDKYYNRICSLFSFILIFKFQQARHFSSWIRRICIYF